MITSLITNIVSRPETQEPSIGTAIIGLAVVIVGMFTIFYLIWKNFAIK